MTFDGWVDHVMRDMLDDSTNNLSQVRRVGERAGVYESGMLISSLPHPFHFLSLPLRPSPSLTLTSPFAIPQCTVDYLHPF